jgi:Ca-activated chloride channel family protein
MEGPRVAVAPRVHAQPRTGVANAIRLDVRQVLIPVTVTDPFGAPFAGLGRDAFRLFEDGVEQQISYFGAEDSCASVGVVFDASNSMSNKLDKSREAVTRFFRTSMPGDEFFLVEFNDVPKMLCDFTSDTEYIENALAEVRAKGWTALLDAVYMAVQNMRRAQNPRRALLIVSDGGDNMSRYTESEIRSLVREADVCIYSIGILGSGLLKRSERLLRDLSENTGGRLFEVAKIEDLPDAVAKISASLRNQYMLGFRPGNKENDGLYRKVEVRLSPRPDGPPLRASWRAGYYAPAR